MSSVNSGHTPLTARAERAAQAGSSARPRHTRRPSRPGLVAVALAGAAALTLTACTGAANGAGAGTDGEALRVVATTTQLADFAANVGGDDIELTGLMTAGGSAHHFDPSPADLLALGQADALIVNGGGLELFIDSAVEASGFDGVVIDASEGIDLEEAEAITQEAAHEADESDHAHDDHADHDHDHADADAHDHADEADHDHDSADHDHADHDHGPVNPHFWTAPRYAVGMVEAIEQGLADADEAHAEAFAERADAYIAKLEALDAWAAEQFAQVPADDRMMVSGHDSLRYYLHDYEIEFAGSILPSFEDNAEPSAAELDDLIETIRERGVPAIFVEASMSPKQAEAIARESGAKVVSADTLFTDSTGPEGSGAETYVDATVHNTRVILEAWGVTPEDLPAELS